MWKGKKVKRKVVRQGVVIQLYLITIHTLITFLLFWHALFQLPQKLCQHDPDSDKKYNNSYIAVSVKVS